VSVLSEWIGGVYYALALSGVVVAVIVYVVNLKNDTLELQHQAVGIFHRLDEIDARGTRTLPLLEQRVNELSKHVNDQDTALVSRVDSLAGRLNQIDAVMNSASVNTALIKERQEQLREQQVRILQALDNTYNTLQEAIRGDVITRKPFPVPPPPEFTRPN
jgi:hypothetical protein